MKRLEIFYLIFLLTWRESFSQDVNDNNHETGEDQARVPETFAFLRGTKRPQRRSSSVQAMHSPPESSLMGKATTRIRGRRRRTRRSEESTSNIYDPSLQEERQQAQNNTRYPYSRHLQNTCELDPGDNYGILSGQSPYFVTFLYQASFTPETTSFDISDELLPLLERAITEGILPGLFDCPGTTPLSSAAGISMSFDDTITSAAPCVPANVPCTSFGGRMILFGNDVLSQSNAKQIVDPLVQDFILATDFFALDSRITDVAYIFQANGVFVRATSSPTTIPTQTPSVSPTLSPTTASPTTNAPTPTAPFTSAPSRAPTISPTQQPTSSPIQSPVLPPAPTINPPTNQPSPRPSPRPTPQPTPAPTRENVTEIDPKNTANNDDDDNNTLWKIMFLVAVLILLIFIGCVAYCVFTRYFDKRCIRRSEEETPAPEQKRSSKSKKGKSKRTDSSKPAKPRKAVKKDPAPVSPYGDSSDTRGVAVDESYLPPPPALGTSFRPVRKGNESGSKTSGSSGDGIRNSYSQDSSLDSEVLTRDEPADSEVFYDEPPVIEGIPVEMPSANNRQKHRNDEEGPLAAAGGRVYGIEQELQDYDDEMDELRSTNSLSHLNLLEKVNTHSSPKNTSKHSKLSTNSPRSQSHSNRGSSLHDSWNSNLMVLPKVQERKAYQQLLSEHGVDRQDTTEGTESSEQDPLVALESVAGTDDTFRVKEAPVGETMLNQQRENESDEESTLEMDSEDRSEEEDDELQNSFFVTGDGKNMVDGQESSQEENDEYPSSEDDFEISADEPSSSSNFYEEVTVVTESVVSNDRDIAIPPLSDDASTEEDEEEVQIFAEDDDDDDDGHDDYDHEALSMDHEQRSNNQNINQDTVADPGEYLPPGLGTESIDDVLKSVRPTNSPVMATVDQADRQAETSEEYSNHSDGQSKSSTSSRSPSVRSVEAQKLNQEVATLLQQVEEMKKVEQEAIRLRKERDTYYSQIQELEEENKTKSMADKSIEEEAARLRAERDAYFFKLKEFEEQQDEAVSKSAEAEKKIEQEAEQLRIERDSYFLKLKELEEKVQAKSKEKETPKKDPEDVATILNLLDENESLLKQMMALKKQLNESQQQQNDGARGGQSYSTRSPNRSTRRNYEYDPDELVGEVPIFDTSGSDSFDEVTLPDPENAELNISAHEASHRSVTPPRRLIPVDQQHDGSEYYEEILVDSHHGDNEDGAGVKKVKDDENILYEGVAYNDDSFHHGEDDASYEDLNYALHTIEEEEEDESDGVIHKEITGGAQGNTQAELDIYELYEREMGLSVTKSKDDTLIGHATVAPEKEHTFGHPSDLQHDAENGKVGELLAESENQAIEQEESESEGEEVAITVDDSSSAESPVEAPIEAPIEAPVATPMEAPMETPIEAPVESPVETSAEARVEAPKSPVPDQETSSEESDGCCHVCGLDCSDEDDEYATSCPECEQVRYCSTECLTWDWEKGGHATACTREKLKVVVESPPPPPKTGLLQAIEKTSRSSIGTAVHSSGSGSFGSIRSSNFSYGSVRSSNVRYGSGRYDSVTGKEEDDDPHSNHSKLLGAADYETSDVELSPAHGVYNRPKVPHTIEKPSDVNAEDTHQVAELHETLSSEEENDGDDNRSRGNLSQEKSDPTILQAMAAERGEGNILQEGSSSSILEFADSSSAAESPIVRRQFFDTTSSNLLNNPNETLADSKHSKLSTDEGWWSESQSRHSLNTSRHSQSLGSSRHSRSFAEDSDASSKYPQSPRSRDTTLRTAEESLLDRSPIKMQHDEESLMKEFTDASNSDMDHDWDDSFDRGWGEFEDHVRGGFPSYHGGDDDDDLSSSHMDENGDWYPGATNENLLAGGTSGDESDEKSFEGDDSGEIQNYTAHGTDLTQAARKAFIRSASLSDASQSSGPSQIDRSPAQNLLTGRGHDEYEDDVSFEEEIISESEEIVDSDVSSEQNTPKGPMPTGEGTEEIHLE